MNAKEARAKAKTASMQEISILINGIEKEAKKGKTSIIFTEISEGAMAFLKDEGYEITSYCNTGYESNIIKW